LIKQKKRRLRENPKSAIADGNVIYFCKSLVKKKFYMPI